MAAAPGSASRPALKAQARPRLDPAGMGLGGHLRLYRTGQEVTFTSKSNLIVPWAQKVYRSRKLESFDVGVLCRHDLEQAKSQVRSLNKVTHEVCIPVCPASQCNLSRPSQVVHSPMSTISRFLFTVAVCSPLSYVRHRCDDKASAPIVHVQPALQETSAFAGTSGNWDIESIEPVSTICEQFACM